MTTEQQGARYHALLLLNPHLSALIADGTFQGKCAERLLDMIAACESPADVQRLQEKLPNVPFLDLDLGVASQFV
jgi:hypothetical protein